MFDCYFDNYVKDLEIYDQYENLCRYTGFISDGNKPDGRGILTSPDGSIYEGQWDNGKPHGEGAFKYPNGSKYIGTFVEGIKNGIGTLIFPDGSRYKGEWENGKPHGKGIFTYSSGNQYDGEWKYGKKDGKGTKTTPYGYKYYGEWKNDEACNGEGTSTCRDGREYKATFVEGKMQGPVILTFPNGYKYEGKCIDDEIINGGEGTFTNLEGKGSSPCIYVYHPEINEIIIKCLNDNELYRYKIPNELDKDTSKSDTSSIGTEKPGATISCLPNFVSYLRGRRLPCFSVKHVGGGSALKTMRI